MILGRGLGNLARVSAPTSRQTTSRGRDAGPPLLYFHAFAPPSSGGVPVVMHRLLAQLGLPLVTFTDWRNRSAAPGAAWLPGRYRYFLKIPPWNRFAIYRWPFGLANVLLAVVAGLRAGLEARRIGAGWVLSVADDGFSPIGGHVAARVAGVPHVLWVFDLWGENAFMDVDRWLARHLEGPIWRRTSAIVVHTDKIDEIYRRKHGVGCRVVPTPGGPIDPEDGQPETDRSAPYEIVTGGAVYWAQEEAMRRLSRVCRELPDVTLTYIGDGSRLPEQGIVPDRIEAQADYPEFRRRLRDADILFLGLSFDSTAPDIVRTGTPARLVDFMASGRPLLIHAPPDTHVATYARSEGFAEVVDVSSDEALVAGLRRVVDDAETSRARADRAKDLAADSHDPERVRGLLREILDEVRGRPGD